eukprot:TRINITY_DN103703_c0_g1_i1.p1 TRINITY_DN103703_c0_g1~~TRINITY_DN103703_c0_g1_i1.p1  ORF type:complete len:301 (-),score=65.06 TRINITY_DN103703_c0_g1_i1:414-1316(-)
MGAGAATQGGLGSLLGSKQSSGDASSSTSRWYGGKKGPCLEILFKTGDHPTAPERQLTFTKKPLGLVVAPHMPILVQVVSEGGQARRLGVKVGWTMMSISGQGVTEDNVDILLQALRDMISKLPVDDEGPSANVGAEARDQHLRHLQQLEQKHSLDPGMNGARRPAADPLPLEPPSAGMDCPPSLELVFDTGEAGMKTVVFQKKPLGFNFMMTSPITVRRVTNDSVAQRHGIQPGWKVRGIAGEDVSEVKVEKQYARLKELVDALPQMRSCIAPVGCAGLSSGNGPELDFGDGEEDTGRL